MSNEDGNQMSFEGYYNIITSKLMELEKKQQELEKKQQETDSKIDKCISSINAKLDEGMRITNANHEELIRRLDSLQNENPRSKNKKDDPFWGFLAPKRTRQLKFFSVEQNDDIFEQFQEKMMPKELSMVKCEDPTATLLETILLVFHMNLSRNNAESTLQCVNSRNCIILVSVYFGKANSVQSPKTTLERKYKYVKQVIDIIYEHGNGFYDCETNNKAKKALKNILE